MAYIEIKGLQKAYKNDQVLYDMNMTIEQGELVTLLGPSGCGKSTLLRCLSGLEEVSGGRIFLDGKDITDLPPRKRDMGMVFQQYNLFPNMTVEQNVGYGLKIKKVKRAQARTAVMEALERVKMTEYAANYPQQLSGGQQQRVALARAIILRPKVLLLDEPLSAIDPLLRKKLQAQIRKIQREIGITTVFVTHDQDEAMVMSDRIFLLNGGRLEQMGSPREVYSQPRTHFAAEFIGSYNIIPAEVFSRLTGMEVGGRSVAVRPEMVKFSREETGGEYFNLRARVRRLELHGTILRVYLDCMGTEIHGDLLYDGNGEFAEGMEVMAFVRKESCITLYE